MKLYKKEVNAIKSKLASNLVDETVCSEKSKTRKHWSFRIHTG